MAASAAPPNAPRSVGAFGEPRVQFAQPASPDIRLGILTRDPTLHLNRELGASIAGRSSPAVRLQYVFFSDESRQRGADIVALDRPAWVTAENVCVAKILEWLAHARRTSAATPYVGWLDSDTSVSYTHLTLPTILLV